MLAQGAAMDRTDINVKSRWSAFIFGLLVVATCLGAGAVLGLSFGVPWNSESYLEAAKRGADPAYDALPDGGMRIVDGGAQ